MAVRLKDDAATETRLRPDLDLDVVVIGSGFGGLGAGHLLRRRGITAFEILESAERVGGTWRDNVYPGCACDIPSNLYSFSFAPNPWWTRRYPAQPEIDAYLEDVVDRFGLGDHLRFAAEVTEMRWDDETEAWIVSTADGRRRRCGFVISATGPLSRPSFPQVEGLDSFGGVAFHSARWRRDVSLDDVRVGVIGTGASAVQLVPEIARQGAEVTVFQRTAPWVLPRDDRPTPGWRRRLYARVPFLQKIHRARVYLRQEMLSLAFIGPDRLRARLSARIRQVTETAIAEAIPDTDLRRRLIPDYEPGCKRLLISSDWYPALARSNVQLETRTIDHVDTDGIVFADGERRDVDVLILATGFAASDFLSPLRVFGRDGHELAADWTSGACTYLGVEVPAFPNLFLLAGPSTGLGHNSIVFMIEAQLGYIDRALTAARACDRRVVEIDPAVASDWYRRVQRRLDRTVWRSGCSSWYRTSDGRVDTVWPGTTIEYWLRTRLFRRRAHRFSGGSFGIAPTGR